jgi:O-antigen ligase
VRDLAGVRFPTRRQVEFLTALLVVVASVGWRRGEYFSGSLDPVVLAKGVLTLTALAIAFLLASSGPRRRLGTASSWWLAAVLTSSLFGALTAGHLWAGGIVAARVVIMGATVFLLLRAAPGGRVITDVAASCGVVGTVAAVTGLPDYGDGRLSGGLPAMSANELAFLAGVVVLVLAWRAVLGEVRWRAAALAAFFLGIVWATGSRTALLMVVAGALVMFLQIRRPRVGLVVGGLVGGAVALVAVATTGAVTAFLERDGDGLRTVESRMVAWRDAVAMDKTAWQELFGGGLSVKIIRVRGQFWDTQPLDSSWVSLLVQAGAVGFGVALLWALWAGLGALRAPYAHRVLFLGLLLFLLGQSVLESGLFDATPAFLLFMAVSLLAEGGSRGRLQDEESTGSSAQPAPVVPDPDPRQATS